MVMIFVHMEECQRSRVGRKWRDWEDEIRAVNASMVLSFEDEMGLLCELVDMPDVRERWYGAYNEDEARHLGQKLIESRSVYACYTAVPRALAEHAERVRDEGCVLVGGALGDCIQSMFSCLGHLDVAEEKVNVGVWF